MVNVEEMVAGYKEAVKKIREIDAKKHNTEKRLNFQMEKGAKEFDDKIRKIRAEKKQYQEDMSDHIATILMDIENEKKSFEDEIRNVEYYLGILTGRSLREVHRLVREDISVHNCSVRYFDEMYDDECLSLRTVIVENDSFDCHNDDKYGLYVIGCSENGTYRYGKLPLMFLTVSGRKPIYVNVNCHVCDGENLDELIEYYQYYVLNNGHGHEDKFVERLTEIIMSEKHIHIENEWVKEHYNLSDFEDIIGAMCFDCGLDAVSKRVIKAYGGKISCKHCGAEMKWR